MDISKILDELTLEEKASLCSGDDFWHTKAVERLGIPSIVVADGPHGLRKQNEEQDHMGMGNSVPATCFPTASATACSWDINLMDKIGKALAEECLQEKVSVILGPGANIKRSPLCGRNFEYISEDPYLTGEIAAALINGVQSQGVGTSLKHFALNNQETRRMSISSVVDERAKREIYLVGFEKAVKKAKPWTVMCSYNRENGTYLSDHKELLGEVLKNEWGFDGVVVSDWGACNDRVQGIRAGLDLEMPSSDGKNDEKIVAAVKNGELSEKDLDKAVLRVLNLINKSVKNISETNYDIQKHHALAKEAALKSCVLLKNEGVLPLQKSEKVLVLGEFAKKPRYQGAGSSQINPHKVDNALRTLDLIGAEYDYFHGYSITSPEPDELKINKAVELAKNAKKVVIFAGLTDDYESEGYDRQHLDMPLSHNELIRKVCEVNSSVIVVLQNGAPVEMPWIDSVGAVLENYLGGQAGSSAAVDILYGIENPSGKLAETFPKKLEDNPSYNYFPSGPVTVEYRESIYVGYRYYDKAKKEVLFPFGHGLSYTDFKYSDLKVRKKGEFDYDISATVKNIGKRAGSEVVQLYVKNNESELFKVEKELKGFCKLELEAGEQKEAYFTLDKRAFAFYDIKINDWNVDSGEYGILLGSSSADIRLSEMIQIDGDKEYVCPYEKISQYYVLPEGELEISDLQFEKILGKAIPENRFDKRKKIDRSTTVSDIQHKFLGRMLHKMIIKNLRERVEGDGEAAQEKMIRMFEAIVNEMPLRAFEMMGGEGLPKYFVEGLVLMLNNRFLKGLRLILKKD